MGYGISSLFTVIGIVMVLSGVGYSDLHPNPNLWIAAAMIVSGSLMAGIALARLLAILPKPKPYLPYSNPGGLQR